MANIEHSVTYCSSASTAPTVDFEAAADLRHTSNMLSILIQLSSGFAIPYILSM